MTQLVVVAVAAIAAVVAYLEASRVEQRFGQGPWELAPTAVGIVGFVVAFAVALIAATVVFSAVVGCVGYQLAARYEQQRRGPVYAKPAWMWGIATAVFAFAGAALTSTGLWGVVCLVAGLAGGQALVIADRDALLADKEALIIENQRLVAERKSRVAEPSNSAAAPTREPKVAPTREGKYTNAVASALRAEKQPTRPQPVRTPLPAPALDLLPRRGQAATPAHDANEYEFLPARR